MQLVLILLLACCIVGKSPFLINLVGQIPCAEDEFERTNGGACRYKYAGVYSYASQQSDNFGTGGLTKPITPLAVPRTDSDIIEAITGTSIRFIVKTQNSFYTMTKNDTHLTKAPAVYVPMNFTMLTSFTSVTAVLLSNRTMLEYKNDALVYFEPQPPACVDIITVVINYGQNEHLCITSNRLLYITTTYKNNGTREWVLHKDLTSSIPEWHTIRKFVRFQSSSTRMWGIITTRDTYLGGLFYEGMC
jgi:hypothetical protein